MQVLVSRGLHLRHIHHAQLFDRGSLFCALLRLQVVPMGAHGLEVQWMVWHHDFTAHGGGSFLLVSAA